MPVGDALPEIVVVLGAAACLLAAAFLPRHHQAKIAGLALATAAAATGAVVGLARNEPQRITFDGVWALDDVAAAAKLIVLATTALVVLLSPEWLRGDRRHGEYYAVVLFSAAGAMALAAAADTLELIVAVLLSSVTGYTLAAYHRASKLSVEAGIKYFLIGAFTNTVLLIGVVLLFGLTGATDYRSAAGALNGGSSLLPLLAAATAITIGLAFKLGAVPAHQWVPDVAQGSPAPVAAFLTVVPKVGGLVALARLLEILPPTEVGWRPLVAALAAATMTLGNLAALGQDDLRRLLGWSSVSQSGYALMAVAVMGTTDWAIPAAVMFLAAYALANVAAFGVVVELRGRTALGDYQGLGSAHPWLAAVLVVSLLSLVGVPPLAGFAGKLALFAAALDGGYTWLAAVAVANTVVSLFYYLRVLGPLYFDPAPRPAPSLLGQWAGLATILAGTGVLVAGLAAEAIFDAFKGSRLLP